MLKVMRKYLPSREFMKYATKLFISLMLLHILTCIDCLFLSRFLLCHWKHHWIASNLIRIVYTENVLLLISNQIVKQVSILPWYYYFYAWKMPIYTMHYSLNCPKSLISTNRNIVRTRKTLINILATNLVHLCSRSCSFNSKIWIHNTFYL